MKTTTDIRLLVLANQWPEPTSSAAGQHLLQVLNLFYPFTDTIVIGYTAEKNNRSHIVSDDRFHSQRIHLNDASFDAFLISYAPHIVVFDRFILEEQFGWRVSEHLPATMKILNTEDLHGLRSSREVALEKNVHWEELISSDSVMLRELASIYRCDLSFIISEFEMQLLKKFDVPERLFCYVPFCIDTYASPDSKSIPSFDEREGLIFIGNFLHRPNVDAISFFTQNIWPTIRNQIQGIQCHIYGAYSPVNMTSQNGIVWHGAVDSIDDIVSRAKVNLAPLRFGAGLKGKVIEAMRNGLPSVMTEIAAEGIFGDFDSQLMVAKNWSHFTDMVVDLYTKPERWYAAQSVGFDILRHRFDQSIYAQQFAERVTTVLGNLEKHRKRNLTGALLHRNGQQSTKYLAKWIEAKNS